MSVAYTIIDKYYPELNDLKRTLLIHSQQVAEKALLVAKNHPELDVDVTVLEVGALLHDIGIFKTWAPGIFCFGKAHYLMHGFIGAQLMRDEGLEVYARICERHTGTGLSGHVIKENQLPIPVKDYFPETLEEKIICYADKFYSKSHLDGVKTVEYVCKSLSKWGDENVIRFMEWHHLFG
ncbi:MAG: HDIG domain-containing protein [Bacteroidaceae bacterium]|nr:HDIG domain-containing protein [Bacteroidaceae bacterium]